MAECTFFKKSDRSGRIKSEKSNFVLQELSCQKSIYVLSEGVSGNRISGMPLLCDEITKENWKLTQHGIDEVLAEIKRIVSQFQIMMQK